MSTDAIRAEDIDPARITVGKWGGVKPVGNWRKRYVRTATLLYTEVDNYIPRSLPLIVETPKVEAFFCPNMFPVFYGHPAIYITVDDCSPSAEIDVCKPNAKYATALKQIDRRLTDFGVTKLGYFNNTTLQYKTSIVDDYKHSSTFLTNIVFVYPDNNGNQQTETAPSTITAKQLYKLMGKGKFTCKILYKMSLYEPEYTDTIGVARFAFRIVIDVNPTTAKPELLEFLGITRSAALNLFDCIELESDDTPSLISF